MASNFNEVYKTPPSDSSFKKEWEFFVLGPQEELPLQVMKDEPFWILHPGSTAPGPVQVAVVREKVFQNGAIWMLRTMFLGSKILV